MPFGNVCFAMLTSSAMMCRGCRLRPRRSFHAPKYQICLTVRAALRTFSNMSMRSRNRDRAFSVAKIAAHGIGASTLFRSCAMPLARRPMPLEPLRARQLLLELAALSHVALHCYEIDDAAALVAQRLDIPIDEKLDDGLCDN